MGGDVEWVPLRSVAHILNGYAFKSSMYSVEGIRVVRISDVQKGQMSHKDLKFYPFRSQPDIERYMLASGDLVMSLTGNCGRVAMLSDDDLPAALNQRVACLRVDRSAILTRYLFHLFDQTSFEQEAMGSATGGGQKNLSTNWLGQYPVPIPCPDDPEKSLAIQGEIVRILDSFTELTAELTAELKARKKQYNHYRDQLLSFEEGEVEWKTLVEVADFRRGTAITKKQTTEGDIPVVANGPASTYSHGTHNRQGETVVIARSGAYAGYVSYWNEPIFLTDAFSVHPHSQVLLSKFVYYLLQNKQEQIHAMKKGAGVPHVRVKEIELYDVPVPSLTEQTRIVAILDKFDALTSSLSEGLPREIELRQKQYEYYRDFLLAFPKPEEAA